MESVFWTKRFVRSTDSVWAGEVCQKGENLRDLILQSGAYDWARSGGSGSSGFAAFLGELKKFFGGLYALEITLLIGSVLILIIASAIKYISGQAQKRNEAKEKIIALLYITAGIAMLGSVLVFIGKIAAAI